MKRFKANPNYLRNYCLRSIAVFLVADLALWQLHGLSLSFSFEPIDWLFPLAALLLCGLPSSILHNCAHYNVGGRRFNRMVGEICGTIMMYGFVGFRLGHMFHHQHPDNPQYDPHPPRGLSFPRFLIAPIKQTLVVVENAYYEQFGRTPETERAIQLQKILFDLGIVMRLTFWILLFGPKIFLIFFLPLYLANIFVFAHINFATHIERSDGFSEIINLERGLYYRFVNVVSLGGYYHKNHHLKPKALNPGLLHLPLAEDKPLLTFQMPASARPASVWSLRPMEQK